ncbi:MAG: LysE family transporter [Anaerolineae bacterium]
MGASFFLRGLALGFAIAAPVGPIGVLCIRRTLAEGRLAGLVSGLGAATADALYGLVAAFGLTFISNVLLSWQSGIRLAGGLFLLYLGIKTLLAPAAERPAETQGRGWLGNYTSTLALTLTNPITILSFAAVFAGLGLGSASGNYLGSAVLVAGVFSGSALWWLTLSTLVSLLRSRITPTGLRWINRISGVVILGFAIAALAGLLR